MKRTALQHSNPVESEAKLQRASSPSEGTATLLHDIASPPPAVPTMSPDASHVPPAQGQSASGPASPNSNRDRFLKGLLPARTCCNLELVRAPAGTKFTLTAVCIAIFPASENPDRRYIQLADNTGSVGVTVWNHNVHKFSCESIGRMVTLVKAVMGNHNGKKQLTLARDSSVNFVEDAHHSVASWWQNLLKTPAISCGAVHDIADNTIVSVSGVVGFVSSDTKIVNGSEKLLVSMHLVDSSGKLDIRTWNHSADAFLSYVERPVLIRRIRVTSFAGTKIGELLDGTGSIIETSFVGRDALVQFWAS